MTTLFLAAFSIISGFIEYAAWTVGIGVLSVVLIIGLLVFIIARGCPSANFTPLSIVATGALAILLCFQSIPVCGAIGLKSYINEMSQWVNEAVVNSGSGNITTPIASSEAKEIVDQALEKYPMIGRMFDSQRLAGLDPTNIADEANNRLDSYILKKLLWAFIELAVGTFIIIKTLERIGTPLRNRRGASARLQANRRRISPNRRRSTF